MAEPLLLVPSHVNEASPAAGVPSGMVLTSAPLLPKTCRFTEPAPAVTSTPPLTVPPAGSAAVELFTITSRPSRLEACNAWFDVSEPASEVNDEFSWLIPVTVPIWDSCELICEVSIGWVGSWFCSWVIIRFRKSIWLMPSAAAFAVDADDEDDEEVPAAAAAALSAANGLDVALVVMVLMVAWPSSVSVSDRAKAS